MSEAVPVVELRNITKRFPGIVANDAISLKLRKGEIHALLGENGAGKSTLMNIVFGLYQPDEGSINVQGKEVSIDSPNRAIELGIGMVHQHFKLVQPFTVTENIILGMEPKKGLKIDYQNSARQSTQVIRAIRFTCGSQSENRRYFRRHAAACGNIENAVSRRRYSYF